MSPSQNFRVFKYSCRIADFAAGESLKLFNTAVRTEMLNTYHCYKNLQPITSQEVTDIFRRRKGDTIHVKLRLKSRPVLKITKTRCSLLERAVKCPITLTPPLKAADR